MKVTLTLPVGACRCSPDLGIADILDLVWSLRHADTALLDYLTQARYDGADAAPMIDGAGSAAIATASALLVSDVATYVATHPQHAAKGKRAVALLVRFGDLATAFPTATWHAA